MKVYSFLKFNTTILSISATLLIVLTLHALTVHSLAGELSPWEIVVIELLWTPIIFNMKYFEEEEKVGMLVLFATYSGYFLPRLFEVLPSSMLSVILSFDISIHNSIISFVMPGVKILLKADGNAFISYHNTIVAHYLVGCSGLRLVPMLILMVLPIPSKVIRKLAAILVSVLLAYPLNAIRIVLIVLVYLYVNNIWIAHLAISPIFTILSLIILMELQDIILDGLLSKYIIIGVESLAKLLPFKDLSNETERT